MVGGTSRRVEIPYAPRPLQREVSRLVRLHRFVVLVCHRRFGKTVLAVNINQQAALICRLPRPRVGYIGPTYTQGKTVAWDYMQYYARPIPGVLMNQSELRVDYPNGGQSRIYGADNPDALRGIYLDRVALDEYGLHDPKIFTEVVGATLIDRGGSALFLGTPNGKGQFYQIVQQARAEEAAGNPDWVFREYKASQTGILPQEYLDAQRKIMTEDEYLQEFECSFEAAVRGAIFARELQQLRSSGHITNVPYDPLLPVDTDWDLGVGDATAIWFSQSSRSGEIRLIDFYEASGEGLPHYVQVLRDKGYTYGTHWAPHDIAVRELGSGKSRLEVAAGLGLSFEVTPRVSGAAGLEIEEGISASRLLLGRCWFDLRKCDRGLEALMHYRRDYNSRLNEFKATPVHDWASHAADAFRGLAVRHRTPVASRIETEVVTGVYRTNEESTAWMA